MGLHGEEHWARRPLAPVEEDPARDEVPGFLGDDVAGEEVNMLGGVLPSVVVGSELTAVSGVSAVTGGLNLDSYDAGAEIEGNVEGLGVSPCLQDGEAAAEGFGWDSVGAQMEEVYDGVLAGAARRRRLPAAAAAR